MTGTKLRSDSKDPTPTVKIYQSNERWAFAYILMRTYYAYEIFLTEPKEPHTNKPLDLSQNTKAFGNFVRTYFNHKTLAVKNGFEIPEAVIDGIAGDTRETKYLKDFLRGVQSMTDHGEMAAFARKEILGLLSSNHPRYGRRFSSSFRTEPSDDETELHSKCAMDELNLKKNHVVIFFADSYGSSALKFVDALRNRKTEIKSLTFLYATGAKAPGNQVDVRESEIASLVANPEGFFSLWLPILIKFAFNEYPFEISFLPSDKFLGLEQQTFAFCDFDSFAEKTPTPITWITSPRLQPRLSEKTSKRVRSVSRIYDDSAKNGIKSYVLDVSAEDDDQSEIILYQFSLGEEVTEFGLKKEPSDLTKFPIPLLFSTSESTEALKGSVKVLIGSADDEKSNIGISDLNGSYITPSTIAPRFDRPRPNIADKPASLLEDGDILIPILGWVQHRISMIKLDGKHAKDVGLIASHNLIIIRPDRKKWDPEFLFLLFKYGKLGEQFLDLSLSTRLRKLDVEQAKAIGWISKDGQLDVIEKRQEYLSDIEAISEKLRTYLSNYGIKVKPDAPHSSKKS